MTSASIDRGRGRAALIICHCAGMVDLVGLPLWMGVLIEWYRFDPQQAGGLATFFLAGIVAASALLAPRFHRLPGRAVATVGFGIAAACLFAVATTRNPALLTALHAIGGLATGAGLSITHGTFAQGGRPHRLIAIAGVALGVFAVAFMALVPGIIAARGGPALFIVFGVVMTVAALAALLAFPSKPGHRGEPSAPASTPSRLLSEVWFGLAGFASICLVHAMANSFLERVGIDHGFSRDQVASALLTMALVSMFPGALAAYLEHRLSVRTVLFVGPILHAALVVVLMNATNFPSYAVAMAALPSLMIFMHTFSFGAIAKLDRSGRSLAAFPASIMIGSALGPLISGTLVKSSGYSALATGAVMIAVLAVFCFSRLSRLREPAESGQQLA